MKLKVKQNYGITLIALVVTIIVLLILAGISISMLTGQNGILNRATEAKRAVEIAQIIEQVRLEILAEQALNSKGEITSEKLKEILDKYFTDVPETLPEDANELANLELTSREGEYPIKVGDIWSGTLSGGTGTPTDPEEPIDNSGSLVLGLVDDLGTSATIYLYGNSAQITSGDITITMPDNTTKAITAVSDNTTLTNTDTETTYATYTVTKNGTYTFSVTDGTNTTETKVKVSNIETFTKVDNLGLSYVTCADGTTSDKAYNYNGASVPKGFYVDIKTNVDTGLVITDSIDSEGYSIGNEWVWVPVNSTVGNDDYSITESGSLKGATSVTYTKYSKLYSFSHAKIRDAYGTFYPCGTTTGTLGKPSGTSGYREPSLLTDTTYGESTYYSSINNRTTKTACTNVTEVATQYITDYENMVESVKQYGGFYIGRYEITAEGEKAGDSLTGTEYNWYSLYNECISFDRDNVTSGMIYGTLWDATMQWLANSGYNVGYTGETTSGYGNYYNEAVIIGDNNIIITVKPSGTGVKLQTGQTSYTRSNNIYDLSGNCYDWTQEAESIDCRVLRRR